MNNDIFLVEPQDMAVTVDLIDNDSDIELKNRAFANIAAAKLAKKCLDDYSVDTETGIHNVAQITKNIDISDIYIDGNFINIRIYFEDNELCVPKSHFDLDILPEAYMFIKLEKDLSEGSISGFLFPEDIDETKETDGYYFVTEDSLKSFYDLEARLSSKDDEGYDSDFEKDVYSYLDGKLEDVKSFYKTLISSESARIYLKNAAKAHFVFSSISFENEVAEQKEELIDESESDTLEFLEEKTEEENLLEESTELSDLIEHEEVENYELDEIEDSPLDLVGDITEETSLEEVDSNELFSDTDTEVYELPETSDSEESAAIEDFDTEETEPLNEDESEVPEENSSEVAESSESIETESIGNYEPIDYVEEESDIDSSEVLDIEDDNNDLSEFSEFDYSTEIMPSINTIENTETEENTAILESLPDNESEMSDNEDIIKDEQEENIESEDNEKQIDELFTHEGQEEAEKTKKKSSLLPLLGAIVVISAAGYLGYTKYFASPTNLNKAPEPVTNIEKPNNLKKVDKKDNVAMPIETVEKTDTIKTDNQAVSVDIPAIEQNLNASIEVSNLVVNWEVPVGYANNTTAKRYFVKVGKILQINLKTELLLLSSPPITNKIAIELEYNKDANKFGISKIINSSGVTKVDDVVKSTVNKVLGMNLNTNMSVFNNIQGNPVLVIKL